MWRLYNKWFGWDYAHLENGCDSIVRRVRRNKEGDRYVEYFSGHLVFIDKDGHYWDVTPLTYDGGKAWTST